MSLNYDKYKKLRDDNIPHRDIARSHIVQLQSWETRYNLETSTAINDSSRHTKHHTKKKH